MSEYDYALPPELIAQTPLADRTASRLMIIDRTRGRIMHTAFSELGSCLRHGDLLVLNDSRVIPARLRIQRESGGHGELLLLHRTPDPRDWVALAHPAKRLTLGETVHV